jgi:hypothetical protein
MSPRSLGTKPPCRLNRCTLTALTLIVGYPTDIRALVAIASRAYGLSSRHRLRA